MLDMLAVSSWRLGYSTWQKSRRKSRAGSLLTVPGCQEQLSEQRLDLQFRPCEPEVLKHIGKRNRTVRLLDAAFLVHRPGCR